MELKSQTNNLLVTTKSQVSQSVSAWTRWGLYLLASLIAIIAKLPILNNNLIFIDEPGYLSHALRLPTVEAFFYSFEYHTETKFPLGLLPYMVAQGISQPNVFLLTRLFGLAMLIWAAILLIKLSKIMFEGDSWPGFFALLVWVFYLNRNELTIVPLLEYYQTPVLLLCLWFMVKVVQDWNRPGWYMFGAGVCLAIAGLIKPSILLLAPVQGLIVLGLVITHDWRAKSWKSLFVSQHIWGFGLGVIIPLLVFLVPYFVRPETLPELRFNLFELTASYSTYSKQSLLRRVFTLFVSFGLTNLILTLLFSSSFIIERLEGTFKRRPWKSSQIYQLFLLLDGVFLFLGFVPAQVKAHYLVVVLPFFFLLIGYRLRLLLRRLLNPRLQLLAQVFIAILILVSETTSLGFYLSMYSDNGKLYKSQQPDVDVNAVAAYIRANSSEQDYLWVYYNSPELYWLANRKPATNEPPSTWLIDFNNQVWYDRTYNQLKRDNPAIIIGINTPRYFVEKVPLLEQLPRVSDLLKENYICDDQLIVNTTLCKRKK